MLLLKKIIGAPVPDVSGHYSPNTIFFSLNPDNVTFKIYISTADGLTAPSELEGLGFSISSFVEGILESADAASFADAISAVKTTDIVDNLTTNDATAPLSAAQGRVLGMQLAAIMLNADPAGSTLKQLFDMITGTSSSLTTFKLSDDAALDTFQKVVTYIKATQTTVAGLATSKLNISDVINALNSTETAKALSAAQGKALNDLVTALTSTVTNFKASNDASLDTFQELVTYAKATQSTVTGLGTSKLNVSDVLNVLTSTETTKALSAAQGKVLNDAIAAVQSGLLGGVATQGNTLKKLYDLIVAIQTLLGSDDISLDTVQEIVTYIKANQAALTTLGQNKVNISDVINTLTSTETTKPLAAAQGKALNDLITALTSTVSGKEAAIATSTADKYFAGDKSWKTFATDVLGTALSGLSLLSGVAITASDSIISALGKLQKQVTDRLSKTAGGTISGAVMFASQQTSGIVDMAAGSGIDCSLGNYYIKTVTANTTFSFSNVPSGAAYGCTLLVTHTSGSLTFPASVKFLGDATPTLTTGKKHLFTFVTDNGGTSWRASVNSNYSA